MRAWPIPRPMRPRKIKQNAVRVNGKVMSESNARLEASIFATNEFNLQVGRKIKRIVLK